MTQSPPQLTDRAALTRFRRRLTEEGQFLIEVTADEIKERLELVNRTFTSPAVVSGQPKIWAKHFPEMTHVTDDEVLDLQPGAHDLVIHALSLHWANDPVGQMVQCRHALKPDGFFLTAMFGGQTLQELRIALAEAETSITGGLSPRVLPMAEIRDLGGLLQRAGYALPVADSTPRTVSYRDALHLMHDLRAMGEGNALTSRRKATPPKALFPQAAAIYAQNFGEDGRIPATFETIFLTGWSPDASQQKPLRPGSAESRLADALGTRETKL
ncbi:methyltransferase domain-containing protein [Actibacterium pelagium]|nr:SAM-dependent methyltransferase [Actibacterium pelagium]